MKPIQVITIIVIALSTASALPSVDIAKFFGIENGNLTAITWAHAVNSLSLLDSALKDNNIMMLEADVVMGKLPNQNNTIPIMAHPPNDTSDLSLEEFLATVHLRPKSINKPKGIKLDFKSKEALTNSVSIINATYAQIGYPVWLNADILQGPGGNAPGINATDFFESTKMFKNAILSTGWTTNKDGSYTNEHIDEMLAAVANVTSPVTFPIRASLGANSSEQVLRLLSEKVNSTLTIWSSDGDNVDISNLRGLIYSADIKKVYLDVPNEISNELHLDDSGSYGLKPLGVLTCIMLLLLSILF